jgi:hypothetical protein
MQKRTQIAESTALTVENTGTAGRIKVGLITPGWGSSGYYSAKVLENAAATRVFPAGTQMFLDHPGETESYDRPERSVRDLAAVLTEDAVWNEAEQRLEGDAQVFGPYVPLLTDEHFRKSIGVSIRAIGEATTGEAEGRRGAILTELTEGISVDFVTKAGRGGSILAVLESARPERVTARAIAQGVQEATANDTREALQNALRDAYPGEQSWVWVRDFDATTVWFEHETPDDAGVFAQAYSLDDAGTVHLSGDRVEVRVRTEYVPVTTTTSSTISGGSAAPATEASTSVPAPAGRNTPNPSVQEDTTMGHIQVDEAEHGRLTEAAGRVPTLESERDTAVAERDTARSELAEAHRLIDSGRAATLAREAASTVHVDLDEFQLAGIVADYPRGENGRIDEAAFTERATTAVARIAEARGAGTIRGFGDTAETGSTQVGESDASKAVAGAFGRTITEA